MEKQRQTALFAAFLLPALFLAGCDVVAYSEDKKVISDAIDGIDVSMSLSDNNPYSSGDACFNRDKPQLIVLNAEARPVNGVQAELDFRFSIDPLAAARTVVQLPPASWATDAGKPVECFSRDILQPYNVSNFGANYHIVLGTLHIQKSEFVNEFTSAIMLGYTLERSYHVSFTIEPPKNTATGQGHIPRFETTCILGKGAVENKWVLVQC